MFGYGGDDRIWGARGDNNGSLFDHDVMFAGQGNDDLLGGPGTNQMFAWSENPADFSGELGSIDIGALRPEDDFETVHRPFGIYVDDNGGLHKNNG